MKKIFLLIMVLTPSLSVKAETYAQYKKQVTNELMNCYQDPENLRYSAAFNSCLLDASENFNKRAYKEYKNAYMKATNADEKNNLIKDREIYNIAYKQCEVFQNLSYDGFTTEALCKLRTSKDYLSLLTNGPSSYPSSWTIKDRVEKLFIGY